MISRKTVLSFAFATAALAAPFGSQAVDIDVTVAPPPPRYEQVPPPPAAEGYVWTPGYWNWDGSRHVWVDGRYVERHRGEHYVAPRWEEHEHHWRLNIGHWDRD